PGDVLEVRVFNRPQLSRDSVRVDQRGAITMPMIDEQITAACLTEAELAAEIAKLYLKYQRNPHVDVFIKEFNSRPVAVMGAVEKPGQFQLQRRARLLELLSLAGGPSERAGARVLVVRSGEFARCGGDAPPEGAESLSAYELRSTVHGSAAANPYVEPGDVI